METWGRGLRGEWISLKDPFQSEGLALGSCRALGEGLRASSGWVRVLPNERGPGLGLGALAGTREARGAVAGSPKPPLTRIHGCLQELEPSPSSQASPPLLPRYGGQHSQGGRLGVPRARSQWKSMWPSHWGASMGQN